MISQKKKFSYKKLVKDFFSEKEYFGQFDFLGKIKKMPTPNAKLQEYRGCEKLRKFKFKAKACQFLAFN
jgi:hypothetical protein